MEGALDAAFWFGGSHPTKRPTLKGLRFRQFLFNPSPGLE
jgi:hypothetical protein